MMAFVVALSPVPIATAQPASVYSSAELTALFTGISAVALILAAWFAYKSSRAPREIYEEQRRDAEPRIVINMFPSRLGQSPQDHLWLVPAGLTGGAVAGLALAHARASNPPRNELGEQPQLPRILLRITNVGSTVSVGLKVPLRISFNHFAKDAERAGDPDTLGLKRETISYEVTVEIPALSPGEYPLWLSNDAGVDVSIESTGQAFDMDPRKEQLRTLAASSPAPIVLRASL